MRRPKTKDQRPETKGFTLIEVITAIVLIAIIMIPIAMIALEYVRSIAYADSLTQAANLGRKEIAIVNILSYNDPTLADGYDNTDANYAGYNFDLRRTVNYVAGSNNNLKRVRVRVFPSDSTEQLIELTPYIMNVQFGMGSAGGTSGDEKDSFLASGGTLSRSTLSNVTLQNTRATGNITMTAVTITPSIAKVLSSITMGGDTVFSSSATLPTNQPTTIELEKNFFMNSSTTYTGANGGSFAFNNTNRPHTITIVFVFYDGTQSAPYTWTYVK